MSARCAPVVAGTFWRRAENPRRLKSALLRVRNIGDETAEAIANWEKTIDLAGELKRISDFGCHVLIQSDENYPAMLRESMIHRWCFTSKAN